MSGKYKSEDLMTRFGLSHETIRRYAQDFTEFLSEGANPIGNKHRVYNDSDLAVFDVIVTMKATNHSSDEIKAILKAGAEGKLGEILADRPILNPTMERALSKQESANLRRELEQANEDKAAAQVEAQIWRDKAKQYEGEIKRLEKEIESLKSGGRDELLMEIGKLKAMLEMAKGKNE